MERQATPPPTDIDNVLHQMNQLVISSSLQTTLPTQKETFHCTICNRRHSAEILRYQASYIWNCRICKKDMHLGSKNSHLAGPNHQKRMLRESELSSERQQPPAQQAAITIQRPPEYLPPTQQVAITVERPSEHLVTARQRPPEEIATTRKRPSKQIARTRKRAPKQIATTSQRPPEQIAPTSQRPPEQIIISSQRPPKQRRKKGKRKGFIDIEATIKLKTKQHNTQVATIARIVPKHLYFPELGTFYCEGCEKWVRAKLVRFHKGPMGECKVCDITLHAFNLKSHLAGEKHASAIKLL